MKKLILMSISIFISFCLIFIILFIAIKHKNNTKDKKYLKIAVFLYDEDDIFISNLSKEIETYIEKLRNKRDLKIKLEIFNAAKSQTAQDRQIERAIELDYNILCINPVERINVARSIDLCMQNSIPIIFFNRQPAEDDMKRYDKLYYVGTDPKLEAIKQGQMLVDLYNKDKKALDLNGDGKLNYVLLEGEVNHQDSLIRTKWVIKTLQDAKIPINKLNGGVGNWEKVQGYAIMEKFLEQYPNEIELVISNNDGMALGAIEAIASKKDNRGIKIVGIDGVKEALEEIEKGRMYGTVSLNKEEFAQTIIDMAVSLYLKEDFKDNIKKDLNENKYYFINQSAITRD